MSRGSLMWPSMLCLAGVWIIIILRTNLKLGGEYQGEFVFKKQIQAARGNEDAKTTAISLGETRPQEQKVVVVEEEVERVSREFIDIEGQDLTDNTLKSPWTDSPLLNETENAPVAVVANESESLVAKPLATNEIIEMANLDIMENMGQISFAFYSDLPVNSTCSEDTDKAVQACQPCQRIQPMLDFLGAHETNSSQPELVLIPMDLLAALPEDTHGFSETVLRVVDYVVKKDKYIRFGGSDHIFICLLPGCRRVMKEILDKHELGRDTRAMWMGMQSDLEELRELWPCPDRVLSASTAIGRVVHGSEDSSHCETTNQAALSSAAAVILERGAAMIDHMSRWTCSRRRWNVELGQVKGSDLKGCVLIQRHNMCVALVPKCGSSAMIYVLRRMEGIPQWNNTHYRTHEADNGMTWIHPSQFEKYKEIMLDTRILKVALVREPADRLLSGYMDKLYILREFHRIGYEGKTVPTLKWVVDRLEDVHNRSRLHALDEHFRPIIDFGSMRYKRYDFVARVGSFAEDLETLLSTLGLWKRYGASGWGKNGDLSFGDYSGNREKDPSFNAGKPVPSSVHWTPDLLDRVGKIYEEDYSRFDFGSLQSATTS